MNALFSDLCFPYPKFQVRRDALDGTNYCIFISDTIFSPKLCQHFLKATLFVFYSQNPEISLL